MLVCGTEIAMTVREQLPNVFLSIVEAMSHVLIETLARGEADFILCYDVPESAAIFAQCAAARRSGPGHAPRGDNGEPIALVEALEESIAMPEEGDSVRTVVARTARDLGLELKVAYEVRSIAAMKSLVMRGAASAVLPYFAALDEVRAQKLDARTQSPCRRIKRTLFLASSKQHGPFKNEAGLTGAVTVIDRRPARRARSLAQPALGSHRLAPHPCARKFSA